MSEEYLAKLLGRVDVEAASGERKNQLALCEVGQDGLALADVAEPLRSDKSLVLAAIRENGAPTRLWCIVPRGLLREGNALLGFGASLECALWS